MIQKFEEELLQEQMEGMDLGKKVSGNQGLSKTSGPLLPENLVKSWP